MSALLPEEPFFSPADLTPEDCNHVQAHSIRHARVLSEHLLEFFGVKKTVFSIFAGLLAGLEAWRERASATSPIWIVIAAIAAFVLVLFAINVVLWLRDRLRRQQSAPIVSQTSSAITMLPDDIAEFFSKGS